MELSVRHDRLLLAAGAVVAVLAAAVVVLLLALTGRADDTVREGETVTAEVTAVSESGRSLCLARDGGDDCRFPVVLPDSGARLTVGSTVTATGLTITEGDSEVLAWLVR